MSLSEKFHLYVGQEDKYAKQSLDPDIHVSLGIKRGSVVSVAERRCKKLA